LPDDERFRASGAKVRAAIGPIRLLRLWVSGQKESQDDDCSDSQREGSCPGEQEPSIFLRPRDCTNASDRGLGGRSGLNNRRRMRRKKGKQLQRARSEFCERTFAGLAIVRTITFGTYRTRWPRRRDKLRDGKSPYFHGLLADNPAKRQRVLKFRNAGVSVLGVPRRIAFLAQPAASLDHRARWQIDTPRSPHGQPGRSGRASTDAPPPTRRLMARGAVTIRGRKRFSNRRNRCRASAMISNAPESHRKWR
jgi:hypothetical protein